MRQGCWLSPQGEAAAHSRGVSHGRPGAASRSAPITPAQRAAACGGGGRAVGEPPEPAARASLRGAGCGLPNRPLQPVQVRMGEKLKLINNLTCSCTTNRFMNHFSFMAVGLRPDGFDYNSVMRIGCNRRVTWPIPWKTPVLPTQAGEAKLQGRAASSTAACKPPRAPGAFSHALL